MKTYVPISMATLVVSLAAPSLLGQHAQSNLDNMPIFGMPAARVDGMGKGGRAPDFTFAAPSPAWGPNLGIEARDLDGGRLGTAGAHGVEITQVEAGSPAARAGFKLGDIVLNYNGQAVEGEAHLSRLVNKTPAGHQVKIGVRRAGTKLTLTPTVEAFEQRPDSWPALITRVQPVLTPQAKQAGIEGAVLVYAEIGTDGRVYRGRVLEGLGYGLDTKALETVVQWRFNPARKNGVAVVIPITMEVNFRRLQ